MTSLFPHTETVDRITPDGNAWCWVHIAGKRTVRLHTRSVIELDIKMGTVWSAELAAAAKDASTVDHAVSGIRKWLHARPRTRAEAADRLEANEDLAAPLAARVLDRLTASGEIDDAQVADLERRKAERKGESASMWEERAKERGLELAATEAPQAVSAETVAAKRAATFSPELSWTLKARRLLAWLASRGYSEHEATQAVRTVLGPEPEAQSETDAEVEPESGDAGTLES